MKVITGIVKDGQISLSQPVGWPDGTPVEVKPVSPEPGDNGVDDELGMSETEQGDDAESVARWIAEFDAIPPLQMTPAEEAAWQAARNAQKELEKASFNERAEKLRRLWE
jgi:hypothetical protein